MEEKGLLFLTEGFQLISVEGKKEMEKSLLDKHHSSNDCR